MSIHLSRPSRRAVAAAAVAAAALTSGLVAAAVPATAAPPSAPPGKPLTVMTRNIYLGGDINRPLRATAGKSGAAALVAFGNSNDELRAVVDRTDFPVRSKLLAAEIARQQPDVVGLQEVALWRSGPLELTAIGTANAATVDLDFLAILTADLAAKGARYRVVNVQQESDVEGPAFKGNPFAGTMTDPRDVRLTMRDAMLVRVDPGLTVQGSGGAQYATRLAVQCRWRAVRLHPRLQLGRRARPGPRSSGWSTPTSSRPARTSPSDKPTSCWLVRRLRRASRRSCCATATPTRSTTASRAPTRWERRTPGPTTSSSAADSPTSGSRGDPAAARSTPGTTAARPGCPRVVMDATAAGFDHRIDLVLARTATGRCRGRPRHGHR